MQNDPWRVPWFNRVKPRATVQQTNPMGGSDISAINLWLPGSFWTKHWHRTEQRYLQTGIMAKKKWPGLELGKWAAEHPESKLVSRKGQSQFLIFLEFFCNKCRKIFFFICSNFQTIFCLNATKDRKRDREPAMTHRFSFWFLTVSTNGGQRAKNQRFPTWQVQ